MTMITLKEKAPVLFFLLALIFCYPGCSDDSSSSNNGSPGESNLTVSGEIEGEFSGWALFNYTETSHGNSWSINMTDNQTYNLSLSLSSVDTPISQPEPGTYNIGGGSSEFLPIFTDIETGGIGAGGDYEYSTLFEENTGTLTIEESTEETISGSLKFYAGQTDDEGNLINMITVDGDFTAKNQELVE